MIACTSKLYGSPTGTAAYQGVTLGVKPIDSTAYFRALSVPAWRWIDQDSATVSRFSSSLALAFHSETPRSAARYGRNATGVCWGSMSSGNGGVMRSTSFPSARSRPCSRSELLAGSRVYSVIRS
ncbi:hypothetical protein D3C76_611250 [compost metagenome]